MVNTCQCVGGATLFGQYLRHLLVTKLAIPSCCWMRRRVLFHQVLYVSLSVWQFIISLHFFLFSLFPKNLGSSLFFSYFNFNSYSFYFYFFFFTYRSFICFQFSLSIPIWHILSFPARSLLFWFVILFLWPFCEFFFQFIHQL